MSIVRLTAVCVLGLPLAACGEKPVWALAGDGIATSAVRADGERIYACGADGRLRAIAASSGARAWELDIACVGTPAAGGEHVFATTSVCDLVAVASDTGDERWRASLGCPTANLSADHSQHTPLLTTTSAVIAGTERALRAFDPDDGSPRWTTGLPHPIAAAAAEGDRVFVLDEAHGLHRVDAKGERTQLRQPTTSQAHQLRAVGETLIVGTSAGTELYRIRGDSLELSGTFAGGRIETGDAHMLILRDDIVERIRLGDDPSSAYIAQLPGTVADAKSCGDAIVVAYFPKEVAVLRVDDGPQTTWQASLGTPIEQLVSAGDLLIAAGDDGLYGLNPPCK